MLTRTLTTIALTLAFLSTPLMAVTVLVNVPSVPFEGHATYPAYDFLGVHSNSEENVLCLTYEFQGVGPLPSDGGHFLQLEDDEGGGPDWVMSSLYSWDGHISTMSLKTTCTGYKTTIPVSSEEHTHKFRVSVTMDLGSSPRTADWEVIDTEGTIVQTHSWDSVSCSGDPDQPMAFDRIVIEQQKLGRTPIPQISNLLLVSKTQAELNLGIGIGPQGPQGKQGPDGPPGVAGAGGLMQNWIRRRRCECGAARQSARQRHDSGTYNTSFHSLAPFALLRNDFCSQTHVFCPAVAPTTTWNHIMSNLNSRREYKGV